MGRNRKVFGSDMQPSITKVLVGVNSKKNKMFKNAISIPLEDKYRFNIFKECSMTNETVNKHPSTGTIILSELQRDQL